MIAFSIERWQDARSRAFYRGKRILFHFVTDRVGFVVVHCNFFPLGA
jgi:hypothetical protein